MSKLMRVAEEDIELTDDELIDDVTATVRKMPAGALAELVQKLVEAGEIDLIVYEWFAMDELDQQVVNRGPLHAMRAVVDGQDWSGEVHFDPYNDYFKFGPDEELISGDAGTVEDELSETNAAKDIAWGVLAHKDIAKQFTALEHLVP